MISSRTHRSGDVQGRLDCNDDAGDLILRTGAALRVPAVRPEPEEWLETVDVYRGRHITGWTQVTTR